jgi:hypothetical protein
MCKKEFITVETIYWDTYSLLVLKPEGKRPLGRPRRRWVDNIRIGLAKDRSRWTALVNSALNLLV